MLSIHSSIAPSRRRESALVASSLLYLVMQTQISWRTWRKKRTAVARTSSMQWRLRSPRDSLPTCPTPPNLLFWIVLVHWGIFPCFKALDADRNMCISGKEDVLKLLIQQDIMTPLRSLLLTVCWFAETKGSGTLVCPQNVPTPYIGVHSPRRRSSILSVDIIAVSDFDFLLVIPIATLIPIASNYCTSTTNSSSPFIIVSNATTQKSKKRHVSISLFFHTNSSTAHCAITSAEPTRRAWITSGSTSCAPCGRMKSPSEIRSIWERLRASTSFPSLSSKRSAVCARRRTPATASPYVSPVTLWWAP